MLFYENRYKAKASSIASLYSLCCSLQSLPAFSKNLDFYRSGVTKPRSGKNTKADTWKNASIILLLRSANLKMYLNLI